MSPWPLIIYWVFGCYLVGTAFGSSYNRCPNDPVMLVEEPAKVLTYVAIWPAVAFFAWNAKDAPEAKCKNPPSQEK